VIKGKITNDEASDRAGQIKPRIQMLEEPLVLRYLGLIWFASGGDFDVLAK
jgi:hypothetical protein